MRGVVVKFGGSSVATPQLIGRVADGILTRRRESGHVVAVVSAMGKGTNALIELGRQVAPNPDPREMDVLLATGEQVSIALLTMALIERGCPSVSLTGWQAGILTTDAPMAGRIRQLDKGRLTAELEAGKVVVVAGFQGVDEHPNITTLGRGGSDTTAVALAATLGWPCDIYTDVEGIYTVDPRLHPGARKIDTLSHEETFEMSSLGAKVIEPRSVELAAKYGVDLRILLNTMDRPGTRITSDGQAMEANLLHKISALDDVLMVSVRVSDNDHVPELFDLLAEAGVNLDVISQSPAEGDAVSVVFTAPENSEAAILKVLKQVNLPYAIKRDTCKLSIVGNAMRTHPGVAAQAFKAFHNNHLPFYQVSTSEISISFIIDKANKMRGVQMLVDTFGL